MLEKFVIGPLNFQLLHDDFEIVLDNRLIYPTHARISENHFEQGLRILLDNAAKYSPDDRKEIVITVSEDEQFVITSVSDKGIGISEEDINHLLSVSLERTRLAIEKLVELV